MKKTCGGVKYGNSSSLIEKGSYIYVTSKTDYRHVSLYNQEQSSVGVWT